MKFVKPYGNSRTTILDNRLVRTLHTRENPVVGLNFEEFATSDPSIILAQWVSAIDKVAAKPTGGKLASSRQKEFRQKLGEEVWKYLRTNDLLPDGIKKVFWAKIHPYPAKTTDDMKVQIRGRWFKAFFGDVRFWDADVARFPEELENHLYHHARKVHPDDDQRRSHGVITSRATSISSSVPYARLQGHDAVAFDRRKSLKAPVWSEKDGLEEYCRLGNLPKAILDLAAEKEGDRSALLNRHVGGILFDHYGRLFRAPSGGGVLKREEIRDHGMAGLLDYHDAVKDTYRRILSGHRTHNSGSPMTAPPKGQPSVAKSKLSDILPSSPATLYSRVVNGRKNQDVNALIRTGKVAHYSLTPASDLDSVNATIKSWDSSAINDDSNFWTSEGQSQIKRNEALIRIWRSLLASANSSLTDWINPVAGPQGDPTTGAEFTAMMDHFDEEAFDGKTRLMFGATAVHLGALDEQQKRTMVKYLNHAARDLRNASFHFKGRDEFAVSLSRIGRGERVEFLGNIHDADQLAYGRRLVKDLRGANVEFFAKQHELDTLLTNLKQHAPDHVPQPRLNRLLLRAQNTWKKSDALSHLPPSPNYRDLEAVSAMRCRYVVTKLLYDKVFPAWLKANEHKLNEWKVGALDRTTKAARSFPSNGEEAVAKAAGALTFGKDGLTTINELVTRVSAETATEIRVQKGYDPDPSSARDKSKYLDDVLLDIFSLAFNEFMGMSRYSWLLRLTKETVQPGATQSSAPDDFTTDKLHEAEDWQRMFYVILHLVSTSEASQLLHQLKKWDVLTEKSDLEGSALERSNVAKVMDVLTLYLDMADDKFDGGDGVGLDRAIEGFFDKPETFKLTYGSANSFDDTLIPMRGLREALRFGDLRNYSKIFAKCPITDMFRRNRDDLERHGSNSKVARAQKQRIDLHDDWVKERGLGTDDLKKYRGAVKLIALHREISAHIRFINHVKLHRITMRLLGRCADFAGMFERDLYFAILGLMLEGGLRPDQAFTSEGVKLLEKGFVIKALTHFQDGWIAERLKMYFGINTKDGDDPKIKIRNRMQHLSFIAGDLDKKTRSIGRSEYESITDVVNDLRHLMGYDRKLKNAVSKSIIGILAREKLGLDWVMGKDHILRDPVVSSHQAVHFSKGNTIDESLENLNTRLFTKMVAGLFGGEVEVQADIVGAALKE
jgi:hypothetical protein